MAQFERCGEAVTGLMRGRAKTLDGQQDATAQLARALTPQMFQQDEWPDDASAEHAARLFAEQQAVSQRAFARARELDPSHPDVAWLAANHCLEGKQCEAVQQALLDQEPDNIATWLLAMAWAQRQKNEAAFEAAFRRAAAATRYDTHRGAGMLAVVEAYAGLPTPMACKNPGLQDWMRKQLPGAKRIDAETFVEIVAMAGEQATMFAGAGLGEHCKSKRGEQLTPERLTGCIHIYTAMSGGSTIVEQVVAASRLIELSRDMPDAIEWRERYRQLRWMTEQNRDKNWSLDLLDLGTNEVAAMRSALKAQGRWPPPADWLPADKNASSLILTGHPPPPSIR